MNNHLKNGFELLFELEPWEDQKTVLTAQTLYEHQAQQLILARLYGAVRWGKDCFGLHPEGKLSSTCKQLDSQTWEYQLTETIAITTTGQILTCWACQQRLSNTDSGLLVAVPIEQKSQPAPLWYKAEIKCYQENEANALTQKGQGVPIARWLGREMDKNYIPPAMTLGAHPQLRQQTQAIAESVERILEHDTAPNHWLLNAWISPAEEQRFMTMPPMEWLSLHLRCLKGLASQNALGDILTEPVKALQKNAFSLLNLTELVNDIKTCWETVEERLTSPYRHVLTLKTGEGLFQSVALQIEKKPCLDRSQCIVITIPAELLNRPLLLAVPVSQFPHMQTLPKNQTWQLSQKGTSHTGRNYIGNKTLKFSEQTALDRAEKYWVCELLRAGEKPSQTLTLIAEVDDPKVLHFLCENELINT